MCTRRSRALRCLGILLLAATPLHAEADWSGFYLSWSGWADQYENPNAGLTILNTLLAPMGGNFEGMGTAYTAVASDAGFIEANPAASSILKLTELSVLHQNWISDATLESIVYTMRLGNLGVGAAGKFLAIPFTGRDAWGGETGSVRITESILFANASYNLLNTYLNNLHFDGIAVGGNLKVAYRSIPGSFIEGQSGLGVMIDLGVMSRFNFLKTYVSRSKNFSVGAVLKNVGPNVKGEPLPTMLSAGLAYAIVRPVLFSFDVNIPFSFQPSLYPATGIYYAAGLNVAVADFLSIQGGLWLRYSNPRATIGVTADLARTKIAVNAIMERSGGTFSVEAKVNLGDRGRAARQSNIDDLFAKSIKAYAAGDYAEATKLCQEVLDLQSDHAHATLILKLAAESRATQEEIRRKQAEAAGLLDQATGTTDTGAGTKDVPPPDKGLND